MQRVIGLRFLHPVLMIKDVEITMGADTSNHTLEQGPSHSLRIGTVYIC